MAVSPRSVSRRSFVRSSAAAGCALGIAGFASTARSAQRVAGANERVNVGLIGFGLIGRIHARSFLAQPDVNLMALSEVYAPRMGAGTELIGSSAKRYPDFRKMLDDKDVDAVVVATPDHWHALQTMMACAAGKDVYVEKPLTLVVREGRWMLDVARRHKRVVQVGTQNRSGPTFQKAKEFINQGRLGSIVSVQNNYFRNVAPGFGNPPDGEPPKELNWDLWLGPAPMRRYNPNRAIYHFRWFWDYSGGQMTNLGQHSLDLVHWITGVKGASSVYSTGGRTFLKDNCEVPDTQTAIHEYPGFTVVTQYREASAGTGGQGMGGLMFHGTKGTMPMSRKGFELLADPKVDPVNTVAAILGGHPVGGPQKVQEAEGDAWTEPTKDESGDPAEDYKRHARNFVDCVKSRKTPLSDLESGHQIATACHLANISLRTGQKLDWDVEKEQLKGGDKRAAEMLERPYRQPWDKELRALIT
ncbi:MAG TPA: Gfo/Idh/MocA family oxidoreductase [Tepidisphaeraceae bacterium]|nr:Gfo/Idh/MocA family oxidoreductase [Tepidisphaeraceae bacterium]